jgi:hypothetical protein
MREQNPFLGILLSARQVVGGHQPRNLFTGGTASVALAAGLPQQIGGVGGNLGGDQPVVFGLVHGFQDCGRADVACPVQVVVSGGGQASGWSSGWTRSGTIL